MSELEWVSPHGESRSKLHARLAASGVWDDIGEWKNQTRREVETEMPAASPNEQSAEVWRRIAEAWPPGAEDDYVPKSPPPGVGKDEPAFLKSRSDTDIQEDFDWVFDNLERPGTQEKDAPSPRAWAWWSWATKDDKTRTAFFEKHVTKYQAPPKGEEEEDAGRKRHGDLKKLIGTLIKAKRRSV